jgi:SAM-dependent methyltransferase
MEFCEICGTEKNEKRMYSKWGYDILKCLNCNTGRTQIVKDLNIEAIYTESYFQGGQKDGYSDYIGSETILNKEFEHVLRRIKKLKKNGKLLEIGCAYGFFLNQAKLFYETVGIEISKDAADYATKKGNLVYNSTINKETINKIGNYDVVVMLDVIEHLNTPHSDFDTITKNLNPQGIIYITTGDFTSLLSKLSGKNWRLMTPPQHLFFFSKKGIIKFLNRYDIEVMEIRYPWKNVSFGLILYQVFSRLGLKSFASNKLNRFGIPVNLFDAMTIIGVKKTK